METKNNETHLAPSMLPAEVEHKSIICQNGGETYLAQSPLVYEPQH